MAFNIQNVLTTASIVLSSVDDSYKYQAELISSNGEMFQPYDTDTILTFRIYKGFENVTAQYSDIVWRRFSFDADNIEEDKEWGSEYNSSSEIILHKDEVEGKCLIQVDAYDIIKGKRTCIATARIILIDVNEMFSNNYPPSSPIDGTIWIDTNMTPSTVKIWDDINKKWNIVGKSDQTVRNLIRNSNFWTLNTKFYTAEENDYLYPFTINDIQEKHCLRLFSKKETAANESAGIYQKTYFSIRQNDSYSFNFKVYTKQNNTYTGDKIYVQITSIDKLGKATNLQTKLFSVKDTQFVQITTVFDTLSSTEALQVFIGVQPEKLCNFYITELSLYNTNTYYPWELAPEDIADILKERESISHEEVLDALTNNGEIQGIYEIFNDATGKNELYVHGEFIKAESIQGDSIISGAVSHDKLNEEIKYIVDNTYDRVKEWAYGAIDKSTTINGGLIQTNTILANKLMLGDFSNLCLINPDSEAGNLYNANIIKINNKNYFKFDSTLILNEMYGNSTFKIGEVYRLSFEGSTSFEDKHTLNFYIRQYYTDDSYIDLCAYQWEIDYNLKTYEHEFKIQNESDAEKIISHTDILLSTDVMLLNEESLNQFFIRNILINKKASAEMIVDGAITADKIEANAINGKTITGAIIKTTDNKFMISDDGIYVNNGLFSVDTQGNVVAKTLVITGDQIEAGTLSGDLFDQTQSSISGDVLMPNCIKSHHIQDGALDNKTVQDPVIQMKYKSNDQQLLINTSGININNIFKVDMEGTTSASNIAITGGSIDINSKFKVTVAGKMTCSDYELTNGSITKGTFKAGDNNEIVIDKNGINIKDTFKVNSSGDLTCKNITINNTNGFISGLKIGSDHINNNAVIEAKINNSAVTTNKIKDSAVTTAKILDANVTAAKLDSNAVTTAKIADKNVTTNKLADSAITTVKIADKNITKAKLDQTLQDELYNLAIVISTINETLKSLDDRLKVLETPETPEEPENPEQDE